MESEASESAEVQWLLLGILGTVLIIILLQSVAGARSTIPGQKRRSAGPLFWFFTCAASISALSVILISGIATFQEIIYFAGAVGFLLCFLVAEASLLSCCAVDGISQRRTGSTIIWSTYRMVHLAIGLVIMIPTLILAFFPFMTHFQTRMLFNQNFSVRFTSAKLFAMERERQASSGWMRGGKKASAADTSSETEATGPTRRPAPPSFDEATRRKAS